MRIEHIALNIENVPETVKWYTENLGMEVVRKVNNAEQMTFIGDSGRSTIIELYCNRKAPIPNYREMDPLVLHIAFTVSDIQAERDRLVEAGATVVEDVYTSPQKDQLAMLRDPWGIAIQLVQRDKSMR